MPTGLELVRVCVFSAWPYDSGDALYLALGIEEDSETGPHRSRIGKRHAPRVAVHLLFENLGQFFPGSELLGFVFSRVGSAVERAASICFRIPPSNGRDYF
jgi:hypothetical protein